MKSKIRNHYKKLRNNLSVEEVDSKSKAILNNILKHPAWGKAQVIMCYISFKNEVATLPLIKKAWEENKKVIVPVCKTKTCEIIPTQLYSFSDLKVKTMGILEPKKEKINPISPEIIDLCLIPGVVFDKYGHRIGFGKGYYDRFLPNLRPEVPKIALAYALQISEKALPFEKYDVLMDYLCTEKGLYPRYPQAYPQQNNEKN